MACVYILRCRDGSLYTGSAKDLTARLRRHEAGTPLKEHWRAGIMYSDGWVDDARLVVLNALDAYERGATVLVRTRCVSIRRDGGLWRAELLAFIAASADIVLANEGELAALFETDDFDAAAAQLASMVDVAAVTRGEAGSVVLSGDERVAIAAVPVDKVIDTTGAGDQYAAGFLLGGHGRCCCLVE